MPMLGSDGILDLFIIVAAVREDDHRTWIIGADIRFKLSLLDVLDDEVMSGDTPLMIPAITLAIERDRPKWN